MRQWVDLMARNSGGTMMTFTPTFFRWLWEQLITIEGYSYAEVDFHGDLELLLL